MPTLHEFRDMAKELKIPGYTRMKKAELEAALKAHLGVDELSVKKAETEAPKPEAAPEPEATVTPVKEKKSRKPSAWHEYVRGYAKDKGLSYANALKEAGPSYREMKEKKAAEAKTE